MKTAFVGIGSNLGDKHANCLEAVKRIAELPRSRLTGCSGWFLTRPVGVDDSQDWYMNGAASLDTELDPRRLMQLLLDIEAAMGRIRTRKWEPRLIDLDILLFGADKIEGPDLEIPHPLMHLRRFALVPLIRLAPDLVHPSLGVRLADILRDLAEDDQEVIPFGEER